MVFHGPTQLRSKLTVKPATSLQIAYGLDMCRANNGAHIKIFLVNLLYIL